MNSRKLLLIGLLIWGVVACGRGTPEDSANTTVTPTVERASEPVEIEWNRIDPPFDIRELELQVAQVPEELSATFNDGREAMLISVDDRRLMVFISGNSLTPWDRPATAVAEARRSFAPEPTAEVTGSGELPSSATGPAGWMAVRFDEDGESVREVRLMAPHPNGRGRLTLRARTTDTAPDDAAMVDMLDAVLANLKAVG
jgi:hypothetical protein